VLTNGDAALARRIADDMAQFAWRSREALLKAATIHRIGAGVALARQAVAEGRTPVVLCDHSDRSGAATWLLREIVAQDCANTLVAAVMDPEAIDALLAAGIKPGDAFDRAIGGRVDDSAGEPLRIQGTVEAVSEGLRRGAGSTWVTVRFGQGNLLVISPNLVQIIELSELRERGIEPADYAIIAIKSRVHFRRGFHDSGFAPTILLVEPEQPFLGTVRLEALPYRHVTLGDYYPYGAPQFG
jgi:microcystin degradation protein MlrC